MKIGIKVSDFDKANLPEEENLLFNVDNICDNISCPMCIHNMYDPYADCILYFLAQQAGKELDVNRCPLKDKDTFVLDIK